MSIQKGMRIVRSILEAGYQDYGPHGEEADVAAKNINKTKYKDVKSSPQGTVFTPSAEAQAKHGTVPKPESWGTRLSKPVSGIGKKLHAAGTERNIAGKGGGAAMQKLGAGMMRHSKGITAGIGAAGLGAAALLHSRRKQREAA